MGYKPVNGWKIDNSCPESYLDVLRRSALLEHELKLLPHNDPDLEAVCQNASCQRARLPKPPSGAGGGSR